MIPSREPLSLTKQVVILLHNEMEQRFGKISWVSLNEVIMPYFSIAITKLETFDRADLLTLDIASDQISQYPRSLPLQPLSVIVIDHQRIQPRMPTQPLRRPHIPPTGI